MKIPILSLIVLAASAPLVSAGTDDANAPEIYVPYRDVASLIAPTDKAVLMEREAFAKLLAAAKANAPDENTAEVAQITRAAYRAEVQGPTLRLTGDLAVVSLSDRPVAVELGFASVGIDRMSLDGKPAPLGYDRNGRLVLIVTGRGEHKLEMSASTKLSELRGGGMQFGMSLPAATAGEMVLTAGGDLEIHATVPLSSTRYDRPADRTEVRLTLGGHTSLNVVLMGNGRQEDERAILLGTSAATVQLTTSYQTMDCLYTVQVLRRGVRELTFDIPGEWTITDVACPALVKWSVLDPPQAGGPKQLVVRLRTATRGTKALHVKATAPRQAGGAWASPSVKLRGADFQNGYLLVDTGVELSVRGQQLTNARREDSARASAVPGLLAATRGRMFYHWADDWSVRLDLAAVALRKGSDCRQELLVSPEEIALTGLFDVTAIGRELFDLAFELPPQAALWHLRGVTVNGKSDGLEYRVDEAGGRRVLKIELASPVPPEGAARVAIAMRHVPAGWDWPAGAADREVELPLLSARAESVSGLVSVAPGGDLDVAAVTAPAGLRPVTVGRMSALGLAGNVQLAYTYAAPVAAALKVRASRREHRIAADSVGLVTAQPTRLVGAWRIDYDISRARGRTLYLLAAKSLEGKVKITAPGRQLAAKTVVAPGPKTVALSAPLAKDYDLWQLTLDSPTLGAVTVDVQYDSARPAGKAATGQRVPLIRPIGAGQMTELLALQASEELAVSVQAVGAGDVDAVDLPPLPAPASRLLAAFRLESPATVAGATAALSLTTQVHDKYAIPPALAADAGFTTYLGVSGSQRTEAIFHVVNAGMQFLAIGLPKGAELWSVRVAGVQARPQRNSAGQYLVALSRSTAPQDVRVVYAMPGGQGVCHRAALAAATLEGVKINKLHWLVVPPPGYVITSHESDMETSDLFHRPRKTLRGLLWGVVHPDVSSYDPPRLQCMGKEPTEEEAAEQAGLAQPPDAVIVAHLTTRSEPPKRPAADRGRERARGEDEAKPAEVPPPPKAPQAKAEPAAGFLYRGGEAVGRFTLPVELVQMPDAEWTAAFHSLGQGELVVRLTSRVGMASWRAVGIALVLLVGVLLLRAPVGIRAGLIIVTIALSTIVAIWSPAATHFANGAFSAAWWLIALYLAVGLGRWLVRKLGIVRKDAAVAAAAVLLAVCSLAGSPARAAEGKQPAPPAASDLPPIVIPYEGDPTRPEQTNKVLIPYRRFVDLWNRAHPDQQIDVPAGPVEVSLAAAHYAVALDGERMNIVLTAEVKTFGKGWTTLPMPMSGLAVTSATLGDKPAGLQVGPKGMVLTMPGGSAGQLKIAAVTTPKYLGRRGTVRLSLPPLPNAVMTVDLPAADLVLEVPEIEGALSSAPPAADGTVRWTVPLGTRRDVSLLWSPKVAAGAADRTLSAAAAHDVYALHWAMVGVSRIAYTFSAGENERFGLLLPAGATLTDLSGANLRDQRVTGETTIDGVAFKVIEIRLHRPAKGRYELTARWVSPLAALDKPVRLALPRAADVGRESGTVNLHAAGGMTLKVTDVIGGRRSSGGAPAKAAAGDDAAVQVAEYYWPYRPFVLTVQLSRHLVRATVALDQLIRIDRQQVQLLAQCRLSTDRGRIFGASFALPDGYELLSAIGPVVEDHYEQPTPTGRRLHVNFRSGVAATSVALVLVRKDADLAHFAVPHVTALDADGQALPEQTGRLAVQVAASLDAATEGSENLRSIPPRAVTNWLDARQVQAVSFAYSYEKPELSLRLAVRPKRTKVRVEAFGGLTVSPRSAWYSYRLRYTIEGTPLDRVRFTLPTHYAPLVAVQSPAMRSVTSVAANGPDGRTEWTVALVNEVTGVLDVTVNFAVPIDADTKSLPIPRIETPADEGYRAVLAVQNASRHELRLAESAKLAPLPPTEQAGLLSEAVRNNLQFVLQSFTPDWSASLALQPAKPAARIQAVVDLMTLTTVIDRGGRCRYEARLLLQNRAHQFLRVKVPPGLKLWSAVVADQPVKPVTDAKGGAGVVLVPLVKTSPGGLPYDVKLYLAGRAGEGLGLVTQLAPPAIGIEGIDVKRTIWTLRLPEGYRYVQPGGTLSPLAAEVEGLTVEIDALLGQSARFVRSYSEVVSYGSQKGQRVAQYNWQKLNKALSSKLEEAQQKVESGKYSLGEQSYQRLKQKLADQSNFQYGQLGLWDKNAQAIEGLSRGNINTFLNNDAANPGVAETSKNVALNNVPDFVRHAAERQKEQITTELNAPLYLDGGKTVTVASGTIAAEDKKSGAKTSGGGKDGQGMLLGDQDEDRSEVRKVLEDLQAEQHRTLMKRQAELKNQLASLGDNRMERYYQNLAVQRDGQGQQQAQQMAQPGVQLQGGAGGRAHFGPSPRVPGQSSQAAGQARGQRVVGGLEVLDQSGAMGRGRRFGGQAGPQVRVDEFTSLNGRMVVTNGGMVTADGDMTVAGDRITVGWGTGLAVAGGTFSLPVSLPEGGKELSFQGPSGRPSVTVWAIDGRLLDAAYATAGVLVGLVIVWLAWLLGRQIRHRQDAPPRGFLPAYVALGVLLVATIGLASGIILAAVIVAPIELIHRLLSRRWARTAAA